MRVQQLIDDLAMLPTEAEVFLEIEDQRIEPGQSYLSEDEVVLIPSGEGE